MALYVVGTPIGNLNDMSKRAADTLAQVDVIFCEDTRQTRKLLSHFNIHKRLIVVHEHNERAKLRGLLDLVRNHDAALVSDGGLPTISDPGYVLVRACRDEGIKVIPIPGANAALTALIASGFPTDSFYFAGFLPKKGNKKLREVLDKETVVILYESPHRIIKRIEAIAAYAPSRKICIARELTKLHEEFLVGEASEMQHAPITPKGEFVIIIDKENKVSTHQHTKKQKSI